MYYVVRTVTGDTSYTCIKKLSYNGAIITNDSVYVPGKTVALGELIPNCQGGYSGVGTWFQPQNGLALQDGLFYQNYTGINYDVLDSASILYVYPSPFDSYIKYYVNTGQQNLRLILSDGLGSIIFETTATSTYGTIETIKLVPAIYYLSAWEGKKLLGCKRILKQ